MLLKKLYGNFIKFKKKLSENYNKHKKQSEGGMLILNLHERTYNDKKKNIDLLNKMAEKVINKFNLDIDMSNKTILSQLYKEGAFLNTYDVTLTENEVFKLSSNTDGSNGPDWFKDFLVKYPAEFSLSRMYTNNKSEIMTFETLYFFKDLSGTQRHPTIVFKYDGDLNFVSMNYIENNHNNKEIIRKEEHMISADKNDEFILFERFINLKDPYLEEIYPKINDCGANKINIKEFLEALEVIKMLNYN